MDKKLELTRFDVLYGTAPMPEFIQRVIKTWYGYCYEWRTSKTHGKVRVIDLFHLSEE